MIVLGLGYGDEGKGLVTSFLCSRAMGHGLQPLVVRFNGGHQAGHTVVYNGVRHVFSSFGSRTLQGVPTYWSEKCTFYPTAFANEYLELIEKPLPNPPRFYIHPLCPVTTPMDVRANQYIEKGIRHGSVGVGFGTTVQRHESHFKLHVQDLFYDSVLKEKLKLISKVYYKHHDILDDELQAEIDMFIETVHFIRSKIILSDSSIISRYTPIFEGAQGILLDQDFGFFPHVTRSNTTSKYARELIGSRYPVVYVTRSYATRHGNGPLSREGEEVILKNNEEETNKSHEYQGEFRKAPLDHDMLNYTLSCDSTFSSESPKYLFVTCQDQHNIELSSLISKINGGKSMFRGIYSSYGPSASDIRLSLINDHGMLYHSQKENPLYPERAADPFELLGANSFKK